MPWSPDEQIMSAVAARSRKPMRAIRVGVAGREWQGGRRTGIGRYLRGRAVVLLNILDHLQDRVAAMRAAGRILSPAYGFRRKAPAAAPHGLSCPGDEVGHPFVQGAGSDRRSLTRYATRTTDATEGGRALAQHF